MYSQAEQLRCLVLGRRPSNTSANVLHSVFLARYSIQRGSKAGEGTCFAEAVM